MQLELGKCWRADPIAINLDLGDIFCGDHRISSWRCAPASISELPPEVLDHVLLSLHPAEILKIEEALPNSREIMDTSICCTNPRF